MCLDLLAGHMQHDVAEQAALAHAVHGDEGVVVVALGVVRDAVAIAVEQLHAALHHGAALRGLPGPLPHSRQLEVTEGRDEKKEGKDRRSEIPKKGTEIQRREITGDGQTQAFAADRYWVSEKQIRREYAH